MKTTNVNELILLTLDTHAVDEKNRKLFVTAFITCFGEYHEGWIEQNNEVARVAVPATKLQNVYDLLHAFYTLFCFNTVAIDLGLPYNKTHWSLWEFDGILGTRSTSVYEFKYANELTAFFKNCPVDHPTLNIQLT